MHARLCARGGARRSQRRTAWRGAPVDGAFRLRTQFEHPIVRRVPNFSEPDRTDLVFRALADGRRRAMVERLVRGPATVSELAGGISLPTALQHLGVLEEAGIVVTSKVGRTRSVQLVPGSLEPAAAWIAAQRTPAERQADRLVAHLETAQNEGENDDRPR